MSLKCKIVEDYTNRASTLILLEEGKDLQRSISSLRRSRSQLRRRQGNIIKQINKTHSSRDEVTYCLGVCEFADTGSEDIDSQRPVFLRRKPILS